MCNPPCGRRRVNYPVMGFEWPEYGESLAADSFLYSARRNRLVRRLERMGLEASLTTRTEQPVPCRNFLPPPENGAERVNASNAQSLVSREPENQEFSGVFEGSAAAGTAFSLRTDETAASGELPLLSRC